MQQLTANLWVSQSRDLLLNSGILISRGAALLIDPGLHPDEIDALAHFVASRGAQPAAILLTHWHWDHVLGPERMPGVRVLAHRGYLAEVERNEAGLAREVERWRAAADHEGAGPFVAPKPDETLADGDELKLGDLRLRMLHVPGHSSDQLAVYEPASGALWASDILSDVEIPFVSYNLAVYEATLARLAEIDIRVLAPGHGAATVDPAEARGRLEVDRRYLASLHERVQACVAAGRPLAEAITMCADLPFRHRDENAPYHRLNVESAFAALGGQVDAALVGWDRVGE
jgi:glyoxylase-like metal-dependent hydrolase (beta-lactamase superfamily II)